MNIGWIFLICALIILVSMALIPWWKKEHVGTRQAHISGANQHVSARLDALDARLTRREEITRLLREGQKINAIKMYRECTGASLAEARAGVERIELAVRLDPAAPGELPIPALPGQAVDTLEREVEA